MVQFSGKLTGFDEFSKILKDLPDKVEKKVVQKATLNALRSVKKDFKAAAPYDDDGRSPSSKEYGRLRTNIKVVRLKKVQKGQKGARITTGRAFWGFLLEKGTRYIPANPWFEPLFTSLRDRIIAVLGEEISAGIEKEAKK